MCCLLFGNFLFLLRFLKLGIRCFVDYFVAAVMALLVGCFLCSQLGDVCSSRSAFIVSERSLLFLYITFC